MSVVLKLLQQYGNAINPTKCVFRVEQLVFLGYCIDKNGCHPIPERVNEI